MDALPLSSVGLSLARDWFRALPKDYPWSVTNDPYAIWISEVMLQQTVVSAVIIPYQKWMARWPTVQSLAAAAETEVLRAWEGLGYASRARNLHRAARLTVVAGYDNLPLDPEFLGTLPGIGAYTLAALLSFAFHQPALTLDANLKRVFMRLAAQESWTAELEHSWRALWSDLVPGSESRDSNLALMLLGQRICRPRGPLCGECPLGQECRGRASGRPEDFPVRMVRTVEDLSTTVVLWSRGDVWWLGQPTSGRFSSLWLIPPGPVPSGNTARALSPRLHSYTRYRDRLSVWTAIWTLHGDPVLPSGWRGQWVTGSQADSLGMVSTYRRILDEAQRSF